MKRKFRDYIIKRTCKKKYRNYPDYKPYLATDFQNRCAYCNLQDSRITTPFEVDHFIPKKEFEQDWPECETLYDNLIYSCKKCNGAKGKQFSGDISRKVIHNEDFYNPVETDYGEIFYRNDEGGIASEDKKGREMICKLKLYRPIHNMAWICEMLSSTRNNLDAKINQVGAKTKIGKLLIGAKNELNEYYILCNEIFIENYNDENFEI